VSPHVHRLLLLIVLAGLASVGCDDPVPFTDDEWSKLQSLGPMPAVPADDSNEYAGNAAAAALGQKLYFDTAFSGVVHQQDSLYRDIPYARAPRGEEAGISCATCHDPARAGADTSSIPGDVSIGGGAYDVNGQQTVNAVYYPLLYWNGRSDSLWSQIVAVAESEVSLTSDRLKVAWRMADTYRDDYVALFGDKYPLPAQMDSIATQSARLEDDGTCVLVDGDCPPDTCAVQANTAGTSACLPRFPLRGKPGWEGRLGVVEEGVVGACQRGLSTFPVEPFNDAYDCMAVFDQRAVTRIYVNWAKAIAAYEALLVTKSSPFDRFIAGGPDSAELSAAAKRGAKLFVGKAACIDCHSTPLFSDQLFHNVGVPQTGPFVPTVEECPAGGWCDCVTDDTDDPQNCLPVGYREGLRRLQANTFRRDSLWSDDAECQAHAGDHMDPTYAAEHPGECQGRVGAYTKLIALGASKSDLIGQWRTPSLRDVALTAPYMHDGLYQTLDDVVWHYNLGGETGGVVGVKDPRLQPLLLTDREIADLTAFLQSLTSDPLPAELTHAP
jgi:cytochrome c peroxidase